MKEKEKGKSKQEYKKYNSKRRDQYFLWNLEICIHV